MQHDMVTVDHGSNFHALRGLVDDELVCIVTPRVLYDASERRIVRDLVRRQGGDCDQCRACIVGRHSD